MLCDPVSYRAQCSGLLVFPVREPFASGSLLVTWYRAFALMFAMLGVVAVGDYVRAGLIVPVLEEADCGTRIVRKRTLEAWIATHKTGCLSLLSHATVLSRHRVQYSGSRGSPGVTGNPVRRANSKGYI